MTKLRMFSAFHKGSIRRVGRGDSGGRAVLCCRRRELCRVAILRRRAGSSEILRSPLTRSSRVRHIGALVLSALLLLTLVCEGLGGASDAWGFWERSPATVDHRDFEYGWLSYADARLPSGERYKRYRVPVRAGERLRIQAASPHFSPVIELRGAGRANAADAVELQSGALKGRSLEHAALHDGELDLYVRASERGEMGVFRLQVLRTAAGEPSDEPEDALPESVLLAGVTLERTFAEGGEPLPKGGFVMRYQYEGQAGAHVQIRAKGRGFTPAIQLVGHGLSSGSGGASNGRSEAVLDVVLPTDGAYTVSVFSERAKLQGAYSVSLRRIADEGDVGEDNLHVGDVVSGRLESGDLNRSHGQWVDRYLLRLEEGEEVAVDLRSANFDAYLYVVFPDQGGEESDDASPKSTDARVNFRAPTTGVYEVFATSYRRGETGAYELETSAAAATTVEGSERQTEIGEQALYPQAQATQQGVLELSERRMDDGSYYDAYALEVKPGQRWTIELRSDTFDTHLELLGDRGLALSNDDANSNTSNSRLSFKTPKSQQVTIYVTSHRPETSGQYELRVYQGKPSEEGVGPGIMTEAAIMAAAEKPGSEGKGEGTEPRYGRVFALMIGISKYGDPAIPDLPYCAADAVKIQTALSKSGMLAPESITLVDASATRTAVVAAFEELSQVVGPDDVFFMFFSGHGGQVPTDDRRELDGLDETLVFVDEMVTDRELAALVETIEPRLTIVALDACYSGGFRAALRSRKNQVGIFSSEEDVASLVASEFKAGGYLAHIIARALGPEADLHPRDGKVTVDELLQFIRREWADAGRVPSVDSALRNAHQHLVIERGATSSQEVVLTRPLSLR